MNKIKRLCFLLVSCGLLSTVTAQTVKPVTVSAEDSFTDNIALLEDSRDMDMMVKFVFNEETNQLTVSLISYRSLFVFRDDTRYKMAVKCRKLRPDRFPYIVEAEPGVKFKLTKDFRRSLPKPRKKYIFKRWVEYDGLQPVPMEYKMVNDFIEQTFDIMGKRDDVTVTLRDLMVMEAYRKNQSKPPVYSLFFRKDLNTKYQIHIQRNPCFGQDEEIAAATNACEGIAKAYQTFKTIYGSGQVANAEKLDAFKELKAALQKQYQKMNDVSPCQTIQDARDKYNTYVDSIAAVNCVIHNSGEGGGGGGVVTLRGDGKMQRPNVCFLQVRRKLFRDPDGRAAVGAVDAFHDPQVKALFRQRGDRLENGLLDGKARRIESGQIMTEGRFFPLGIRKCPPEKCPVRPLAVEDALYTRNAAHIQSDTLYHSASPSSRFSDFHYSIPA